MVNADIHGNEDWLKSGDVSSSGERIHPKKAKLENPLFGGHDWYHGTKHEFEQFSNNPPERNNNDEEWNTGLGTHLTSHPRVTSHFVRGSNNGRVIRAHLNIHNPKRYDSEASMGLDAIKVAKKHGIDIDTSGMTVNPKMKEAHTWAVNDAIAVHPQRKEVTRLFKEHLKSKGHDGIVYHNDIETPTAPAAIAFEPHQIDIKEHHWNPSAKEADHYFGTWGDACPKCQGRGGTWHEGRCPLCEGKGKLNNPSGLEMFAKAIGVEKWGIDPKSGDGYMHFEDGSSRWGIHGAAGILLRHTGEDGKHRYLLQHRSGQVDDGGTWSTPGGALNKGETPIQGAKRELHEEAGVKLPKGHKVIKTHTDTHQGDWSYTTSVVHVPHMPEHKDGDWESNGHKWVTHEEMKTMPLHPGFKAALPHLIDEHKTGLLAFTANSL